MNADHNKSQNEVKLWRCGNLIIPFLFMRLMVLFKFFGILSACFITSSPLLCDFFPDISAKLFICTLKFARHDNSVILLYPIKAGWHKGHWAFLDSSSKAGFCVYKSGKGWTQGCGACTLLNCCLVCHLRPAIPAPLYFPLEKKKK